MMKRIRRHMVLQFAAVVVLLVAVLVGTVFGTSQRIKDTCKAECIAQIDQRLEEIRAMKLEYDLVLIEYEAKKAKEMIGDLEDTQEMRYALETAIHTIDSLILPKEEMNDIKEAFCVYYYGSKVSEESVLSQRIRFYLGEFGDCQVAVMEHDTPMIRLPSERYYFAGGYGWEFLPEVVSGFHNNGYYSLNEMYSAGYISAEDISLIYERFETLNQQYGGN